MNSEAAEGMGREERALHAYHDGELTGLRRWWFERRLSRSPELRAQLEMLEELAGLVGECDAGQPTVDLWDSIALRLPALDAQRAEVVERPGGLFQASYLRPLAALAVTVALALALFLGIIDDGANPTPGVIRWLDTGGRSVMVLEEQEGATIVWLLDSSQEGASVRRSSEAV
jgi:anti-sigma factor RsiW